MIFVTKTDIPPFEPRLRHTSRLFMLGSCFSVNMAEKLERYKLPVATNPFGPLYNPLSICSALKRLEEGRFYTAGDLMNRDGLYFNYDFHTVTSCDDPTETLRRMNGALEYGRKALTEADVLVLTLGTSFVYSLKESGQVVANCNKMPSALFNREMISVSRTVEALHEALSSPYLSDKRIIFTISPIRHLSDGLAANSLSKARLRVAVEELLSVIPRAYYFPSYEIMLDELRDYRFYADDMTHPSKVAVDYIRDRFIETVYDEQTTAYIAETEALAKAVEHRPLNPRSDSYKKFARSMLDKISSLKKRYPETEFDKEVRFFQKTLEQVE